MNEKKRDKNVLYNDKKKQKQKKKKIENAVNFALEKIAYMLDV